MNSKLSIKKIWLKKDPTATFVKFNNGMIHKYKRKLKNMGNHPEMPDDMAWDHEDHIERILDSLNLKNYTGEGE